MGIASFQVGTAVTLDKGYLDFSEVTLTAYSAAVPITAGSMYQFTGQVAGALAAPLGQGGRIVAVYTNVDGQSAGEDLLWQNPTNFNGTVPVQQTFTANAGAVTLRLALTAAVDAGHLGFSDFDLLRLTAGVVIRRSTYMLAGQAVAVRVTTTDPDGDSGLHYLYSDHPSTSSELALNPVKWQASAAPALCRRMMAVPPSSPATCHFDRLSAGSSAATGPAAGQTR